MTPSLEGFPTKAKEALSPHEVRLTPLEGNPIFQCLPESLKLEITNLLNIDKCFCFVFGFHTAQMVLFVAFDIHLMALAP